MQQDTHPITGRISGADVLRAGSPAEDTEDMLPLLSAGEGIFSRLKSPPLELEAMSAPKALDGHVSERACEIFLSKQESRRRRRTLKECGDFLGVTGVNPLTGEMDVLTPTSSSEEAVASTDSITNPQLARLAQQALKAREEYERARSEAMLQRQHEKEEKAERNKEAIRFAQQHVKWRRENGQWSSVAEPNLSPIEQSQGSNTSPPSETAAARRSPSSFLGMGAAMFESRRPLKNKRRHPDQAEEPGVPPAGESPIAVPSPQLPDKTSPTRMRFAPLIPRRLGSRGSSSHSESGLSESTRTRLSLEETPQLDLENQTSAECWAQMLIEGLDTLKCNDTEAQTRSQQHMPTAIMPDGTRIRSAYTHITTTTGRGGDQAAEQAGRDSGGRLGESDTSAAQSDLDFSPIASKDSQLDLFVRAGFPAPRTTERLAECPPEPGSPHDGGRSCGGDYNAHHGPGSATAWSTQRYYIAAPWDGGSDIGRTRTLTICTQGQSISVGDAQDLEGSGGRRHGTLPGATAAAEHVITHVHIYVPAKRNVSDAGMLSSGELAGGGGAGQGDGAGSRPRSIRSSRCGERQEIIIKKAAAASEIILGRPSRPSLPSLPSLHTLTIYAINGVRRSYALLRP
ncbi:hypothetical protein OQA88_12932 [Cercophora sp. LCS_1]